MSEAPSSSELTKRIRTGIPLATGIALVVFAPTFIVGSKMFFGQDRLEFVYREAKK